MPAVRRSIRQAVSCSGVALHAGRRVCATLLPAQAGQGIVFRRDDLGGKTIPARYDRVVETRLGTVVSQDHAGVGVIEHLMAAVFGAGIDDLIVALDGPEPPILDGDALSWLDLLDRAGVRETPGVRNAVRILRRVEAARGDACAALAPAETLAFDFEIAFDSPAIGAQKLLWEFSPENFRRDIAPARTFGFADELDSLRGAGLARGASLENTLAIADGRIVNAALVRFADEFVRHKILDAIGDLALAGARVVGRFEGRRSGHALNNMLLRALFADPENYEIVAAE
ncbi:MAG TPA: UDP-3-O-acyl-N-acetylglucosamine deacetylase [Rhizomicrobium sp.]